MIGCVRQRQSPRRGRGPRSQQPRGRHVGHKLIHDALRNQRQQQHLTRARVVIAGLHIGKFFDERDPLGIRERNRNLRPQRLPEHLFPHHLGELHDPLARER